MKPIYSYTNFRNFILDWKTENNHTLRDVQLILEQSSAGYMSDVFKGKRKFSQINIVKFSVELEFDLDEYNYFHAMVKFTESKNKSEKNFYKKIMNLIRKAAAV